MCFRSAFKPNKKSYYSSEGLVESATSSHPYFTNALPHSTVPLCTEHTTESAPRSKCRSDRFMPSCITHSSALERAPLVDFAHTVGGAQAYTYGLLCSTSVLMDTVR